MTRYKLLLLIGFICILIYSCSNSSGQTVPVAAASDTIHTKSATDAILYPSDSDTIMLNMREGKATVRIDKKADQHVILKFPSGDYTSMSGAITSKDSTANIRFSQIILPDGRMDGPFGRDITYDLPVKGDYLLLLHENQMAGDPWAGDFQVTVVLDK